MRELKSMSTAVRKVIDSYPAGHQFYGNELHKDVMREYPPAEKMYTDTILRMARRYRRYELKTINHNKSLYEKFGDKPESIIERLRKAQKEQEQKEAEKKPDVKRGIVTEPEQIELFEQERKL